MLLQAHGIVYFPPVKEIMIGRPTKPTDQPVVQQTVMMVLREVTLLVSNLLLIYIKENKREKITVDWLDVSTYFL